MAEYGEWTRKGAVLSEKTAQKEYGVTREFLIEGIRAGKLEYREGVVWGNPYLRLLRRELEAYIAEQMGENRLSTSKDETELRKVKRDISKLKKELAELESRKKELEQALGK